MVSEGFLVIENRMMVGMPAGNGEKTASSEKARKQYTITKSRESWTDQEHDKFLEALHLFDRDWKKIEAFVGSKTRLFLLNADIIRSHAQKYFLKVQKSGTNEHVPPPRPKRKASHPYPQKAPRNAAVASQVTGPLQSSASVEPGYIYRPDSQSVLRAPIDDSSLSSCGFNSVAQVNVPPAIKGSDDAASAMPMVSPTFCYSSSNESPSSTWQTGNMVVQRDQDPQLRVMPDFAQVYSFIGCVFDPNSSNHLDRLKQMDSINSETALLLMRNLSMNLKSPEFENHSKLLTSYDANTEGTISRARHYKNFLATNSGSPIPAL